MPSPIIDIEGGDGNGKSTALKAVRDFFEGFLEADSCDVIGFEQKEGRWPTAAEIDPLESMHSKILVVGEPTYVRTGAAIRTLLHAPTNEFDDPWHQARLYAEARLELVRDLLLPYLQNGGRRIVRSRGLLSSMTYQAPVIAKLEGITLAQAVERVLALEGNHFSISRAAPDLCLLLDLPPDEAERRMSNGRTGGLDFFERDRRLQQDLRRLYHNPVIQQPFIARGTSFAAIDTRGTKEETREQIFKVLAKAYRP